MDDWEANTKPKMEKDLTNRSNEMVGSSSSSSSDRGSSKRPWADSSDSDSDCEMLDGFRKRVARDKERLGMLEKLGKDICSGLEKESGADLTIRTPLKMGSTDYGEAKVHKVILALRAPQLSGKIYEKARNGIVTLEDLTEKGLKVLLKYIYSAELDEEWTLVAEELGRAAEEYQLKELVTFLKKNLIRVKITEENAGNLYRLAEMFEMKESASRIAAFARNNIRILLKKRIIP